MNYTKRNRGITLIELLLYIGLFTLLSVIVFSTVLYVQKIFSARRDEYIVRTQIYEQLYILQKHLVNTERVDITPAGITLYMYADGASSSLSTVHQYVEEGRLVLEYFYNSPELYKKIYPYSYSHFEQFSFSKVESSNGRNTVSRQTQLNAHVIWKNQQYKIMHIYERLYIPNST